MRSLIVVLCLLSESSFGSPIHDRWIARGNEALGKSQSLLMSLGPPNSVQRVETMVETSFVLYANPDTELHSVDASGGEVFHVLLGGRGEFDLVYIYDGEGRLVGTRLDSLPEGWSVVFLTELNQIAVQFLAQRRKAMGLVSSPAPMPMLVSLDIGPSILFDLAEPLHPLVVNEGTLNAAAVEKPSTEKPFDPEDYLREADSTPAVVEKPSTERPFTPKQKLRGKAAAKSGSMSK